MPGCCCCMPLLHNHLMDSCSYVRKHTLLAAKRGCICIPFIPPKSSTANPLLTHCILTHCCPFQAGTQGGAQTCCCTGRMQLELLERGRGREREGGGRNRSRIKVGISRMAISEPSLSLLNFQGQIAPSV